MPVTNMTVLNANRKQAGFSLIEMVIGITTFAIALTIITAVIAPQINRSVDPIFQVRATELSQSMFNEILGKYYDEASDANGGRIRCDEDLNDDGDDLDTSIGERSCTEVLGPESGETRGTYNDVDDFNGYRIPELDINGDIVSSIITNSIGQELVLNNGTELYANYGVAVSVSYDNDQNGIANEDEPTGHSITGNIKLIKVTITMPNDEEISFSSFKHNY